MTTDRQLGGASMPEKVRIEHNRLTRGLSRETDRAKSDEIAAQIDAIEAKYPQTHSAKLRHER